MSFWVKTEYVEEANKEGKRFLGTVVQQSQKFQNTKCIQAAGIHTSRCPSHRKHAGHLRHQQDCSPCMLATTSGSTDNRYDMTNCAKACTGSDAAENESFTKLTLRSRYWDGVS